MPNIASVLKEEILRLARKEVRAETESLKKATAAHRSDLAALKRRIAGLEKQLARAEKGSGKAKPPAEGEGAPRTRFSPKWLAARRAKLGLSAADAGTLLGVSAQTVYAWEAGKTRPRASQLPAIAAFRALGKRQIKARLEAETTPAPTE